MTDRLSGTWGTASAVLALALAAAPLAPAAAQDSETAAPARSIDFRLPPAPENDGRAPGMQGPSNNGLAPLAPGERRGPPQTPTPAPTPAPPRVAPTQPGAAVSPASPARREAPAAAVPDRAASATRTTPAAAVAAPPPESAPLPATEAPSRPVETSAAPVPAPAADDAETVSTVPDSQGAMPVWAWLLAALAAGGAGYWYWRRRPAVAGGAPAERDASPVEAPPPPSKAAATRPAAPHPAPAPARPEPVPAGGAAVARAASPLVTRPAAEQRALVSLALEVTGIRMTAEHVAVAFSLKLANQGAADATGLMVRIALNQGSAMTEPVLARFFDGAGGSVLRDDMEIRAGDGESLATEAMLPRAILEPVMIGGKPMLVPVVAFDVTYHWDGDADAFGQVAGSFVLGREQGTGGSEKLAPLPLDRATYVVDRPGARATAVRRNQ